MLHSLTSYPSLVFSLFLMFVLLQSRYIDGLKKAADKRQKEYERRTEKQVQKVTGFAPLQWLLQYLLLIFMSYATCGSRRERLKEIFSPIRKSL